MLLYISKNKILLNTIKGKNCSYITELKNFRITLHDAQLIPLAEPFYPKKKKHKETEETKKLKS